jgi:hypothetical protein
MAHEIENKVRAHFGVAPRVESPPRLELASDKDAKDIKDTKDTKEPRARAARELKEAS